MHDNEDSSPAAQLLRHAHWERTTQLSLLALTGQAACPPAQGVAAIPLPAPLAGLLKARRRLQVTGRVAVWLLHVANPALAAAAPLHLRGVLASQRMSEEERRTWHEWERWGGVDAGCPGLGAGAASATMQLHLHLF